MRKVKMTSTDAHACMHADVRSLFYLAISQIASVSVAGCHARLWSSRRELAFLTSCNWKPTRNGLLFLILPMTRVHFIYTRKMVHKIPILYNNHYLKEKIIYIDNFNLFFFLKRHIFHTKNYLASKFFPIDSQNPDI